MLGMDGVEYVAKTGITSRSPSPELRMHTKALSRSAQVAEGTDHVPRQWQQLRHHLQKATLLPHPRANGDNRGDGGAAVEQGLAVPPNDHDGHSQQ